MTILRYIPLMGVVLIAYNIFANAKARATSFSWDNAWKTIPLPSGLEVSLTYSEGFIVFALIVLFIEIIKATSITSYAITEQVLSVLVFVAFLFQFFSFKNVAEPTFFLLTIISLLEVLAGFIILTKVAKRDINFGGG